MKPSNSTTLNLKRQTLNPAGFGSYGVNFLLFAFPVLLPLSVSGAAMDKSLLPPFLFIAIITTLNWTFIFWRFASAKEIIRIQRETLYVLLPFLLFVLWSWVTMFIAPVLSDALFDAVKWTLLFSLLLSIVCLLVIQPSGMRALLAGVLASALITSAHGFFEVVKLMPEMLFSIQKAYQIISLLSHKNLLASWLVMLSPLVILGMLSGGKIFQRLGAVALTLSFFCIVMLQSRAAWLAFSAAIFIATVALIISYIREKQKAKAFYQSSRLVFTFIALAFAINLPSVVILKKPDLFFDKIKWEQKLLKEKAGNMETENIFDFSDENKGVRSYTIHERFFFWRNTKMMIRESPVFGHGSGSWQLLFPKYGLENTRFEQGAMSVTRPHNDWLWVWAEKGLVGLLLWSLVFCIPVFFVAKKVWRKGKYDEKIKLLIPALTLVMFAVNGFFDFPMERPAHLGLMVLSLAFIAVQAGNSEQKFTRSEIYYVVMLCVSIGSVFIIAKRLLSDIITKEAMLAGMKKNYEVSEIKLREAQSFIYAIAPHSVPLNYHIGYIHSEKGNPETALEYFKKAEKQHPYYIPMLSNMGVTYAQLNQPDSAFLYFEKALAISPNYENALLNMAGHYFNLRDLEKSYHYISKINPETANPRYRPILDVILKVKVKTLSGKQPEGSSQRLRLESLERQPELLFTVYKNALTGSRSLEEILIMAMNAP